MKIEQWKQPNDYGEAEYGEAETISQELRRLWQSEIKRHFKAEEDFLVRYGERIGYGRPYIARILELHQTLERLVWKSGSDNIREFHRVLSDYIRFRSDSFTERIEETVESANEPPHRGRFISRN